MCYSNGYTSENVVPLFTIFFYHRLYCVVIQDMKKGSFRHKN